MKRRVLLTAHDPGAGAFLRPLAHALSDDPSLELRVAVSEMNFSSFSSFPSVDRLESELSEAQVTRMLEGVTHLVTGTSWRSGAERQLRATAEARSVSVFVGVDSWSNHADRFPEGSGQAGNKNALLWTVDEAMSLELVHFGFRVDRVRAIGHPGWDEIARQPKPATEGPGDVLFLSEPYRMDGADPRPEIWKAVTRTLEKNLGHGARLRVCLKPHPKETLDALPESSEHVRWSWAESNEVLPALVLGFQTMGLAEWKLRGVRAVGIPFTGSQLSGLFKAFEALGVEWVESGSPDTLESRIRQQLERAEPPLRYSPQDAVEKMLKDLKT